MKLTIGDLYEDLGKIISDAPELYKDLIITDVVCVTTVGIQSGVKVEDRLHSLQITAVSQDGNFMMFINPLKSNYEEQETVKFIKPITPSATDWDGIDIK